MKQTLCFALLLSAFSLLLHCKGGKQAAKSALNNQEAVVTVYRCGRGCVNYLLQTEIDRQKTELYPVNLPEDKQKENLKIRFSGELLQDMQQLYFPGPTDIPQPGKKVRQVRIDKVEIL